MIGGRDNELRRATILSASVHVLAAGAALIYSVFYDRAPREVEFDQVEVVDTETFEELIAIANQPQVAEQPTAIQEPSTPSIDDIRQPIRPITAVTPENLPAPIFDPNAADAPEPEPAPEPSVEPVQAEPPVEVPAPTEPEPAPEPAPAPVEATAPESVPAPEPVKVLAPTPSAPAEDVAASPALTFARPSTSRDPNAIDTRAAQIAAAAVQIAATPTEDQQNPTEPAPTTEPVEVETATSASAPEPQVDVPSDDVSQVEPNEPAALTPAPTPALALARPVARPVDLQPPQPAPTPEPVAASTTNTAEAAPEPAAASTTDTAEVAPEPVAASTTESAEAAPEANTAPAPEAVDTSDAPGETAADVVDALLADVLAAAPAPTGEISRIEKNAVLQKIHNQWNTAILVEKDNFEQLVVTVAFVTSADGVLVGDVSLVKPANADGDFLIAFDTAKNAILRSLPLEMPANTPPDGLAWTVTFDPVANDINAE